MFVLTLFFYFESKSERNLVATLATKLEFLVAKEKMLVALATVSVAILSPGYGYWEKIYIVWLDARC